MNIRIEAKATLDAKITDLLEDLGIYTKLVELTEEEQRELKEASKAIQEAHKTIQRVL